MSNSSPRVKHIIYTLYINCALVICFLAVVHTIKTRTLSEFVYYSKFIFYPVYFLIMYYSIFLQKKKRLTTYLQWVSIVFISTLSSVLISPIYYSLGASIKDLAIWLQSKSIIYEYPYEFTVIITLICGWLFFFFRLKLRSVYGLTEVIIGIFAAVNKVPARDLSQLFHSDFYFAVLTAGIYLVVRGLDNMHQGITKAPYDPVVLKLSTWINRNVFEQSK